VTHPKLTQLTPAEAERELAESKTQVSARTGKAAADFCYPYGMWNAEVRNVAARHYNSACTTGAGVVTPEADPYALPRVDAHYVRDMRRFRSLFTSEFERYLTVRRWIRRLRGAPEGRVARLS
jgi:peptidoglycan/xylan/chitin deacetylase (PgdA/CDA1 family)